MKHPLTLAFLLFASSTALDAAGAFLTENGEPRAEIILSEKPQRSARLAAQESSFRLRPALISMPSNLDRPEEVRLVVELNC